MEDFYVMTQEDYDIWIMRFGPRHAVRAGSADIADADLMQMWARCDRQEIKEMVHMEAYAAANYGTPEL